MKTEAISSSEILVSFYHSTRCHMPGDELNGFACFYPSVPSSEAHYIELFMLNVFTLDSFSFQNVIMIIRTVFEKVEIMFGPAV
jgi:hypothetical protein